MTGAVHALALAALTTATVIAVLRHPRRPSNLQAFGAVLAAIVLGAGAPFLAVHGCDLGEPLSQWLVPAICLGVALALVGPTWLRRTLVAACVVAGLALSFDYATAVHGPVFVGVADPDVHHGIAGTEREWHTWLTGLYRRTGARGHAATSPHVSRP